MVTRFTKREIETMSLYDLRSTLREMGIKGTTAGKDDLVRLLTQYNCAGTDEGLLKEFMGRDKERFSLSRLSRVADLLLLPKRNVRKQELIDSIYNHRKREFSDLYVNKWDYWLKDSSFKGVVRVYGIGSFSATDFFKQLTESRAAVREVVLRELRSMKGVKFYETLTLRFVRDDDETDGHFSSKAVVVTHEGDVWESVELSVPKIVSSVEKFIRMGSGLVFSEILSHNVNVVKYSPLRGGEHIPLPEELSNSMKGLINIQNNDDRCLLWCHVRSLRPTDIHPERIKKEDREFARTLNYSGVTFPVEHKDYQRIERQNNV